LDRLIKVSHCRGRPWLLKSNTDLKP